MSQETESPNGDFVPVKVELHFVSDTSGHDVAVLYWRPEAAVIGTDAAGRRSLVGHILGQYESRDNFGDAYWSYLYYPFGSRHPLFPVEHRLRDLWGRLSEHYQAPKPSDKDSTYLELEKRYPLRGAPDGRPRGNPVELAPGWQVGFPSPGGKGATSIDLLAGVVIQFDAGLRSLSIEDQSRASQALLIYFGASRHELLLKAIQEHLPDRVQAWESLPSVVRHHSWREKVDLKSPKRTKKEKS